MGSVHYLLGGKNQYFSTGVVRVPFANALDHFLLLSRCLRIVSSQGRYTQYNDIIVVFETKIRDNAHS